MLRDSIESSYLPELDPVGFRGFCYLTLELRFMPSSTGVKDSLSRQPVFQITLPLKTFPRPDRRCLCKLSFFVNIQYPYVVFIDAFFFVFCEYISNIWH